MRFQVCVLQGTLPIDDAVAKKLLAAAQAMHAAGSTRSMDLEFGGSRGKRGSGRVNTEWASASLGTFTGPLFTASLELGRRSGKVRYIVPEAYLDVDFDPDQLDFIPA